MISERLSAKIANAGFICMCLVASLHINVAIPPHTWHWQVHWFVMRIAGIAVPTFFAISGFLLAGHFGEQRWWRKEVGKRVRSLLVPYVIWNLFYLALSASLAAVATAFGTDFGAKVKWSDMSLIHILAALGFAPPWYPQLTFMWFIRSLFLFVCISPLFVVVRSFWRGLCVLIFLVVGYALLSAYTPPSKDWSEYFLRFSTAKGVCYFAAGSFLRWHRKVVMRFFRRWQIPVFILVGILLKLLVKDLALIGEAILAVGVFMAMPECRWPKWITSTAFPIFLLHSGVIMALAAVERIVGKVSTIYTYFTEVFLVIAISIAITVILRKAFPRTCSVAFGGR